ncbi:chemerin-like receptor 1 [Hyperolius riggenbachi]|uniref:chemerin-like receptor 1 n=1 Tax=Hyperolius riggenbachi TaxID=752182 RepID=UPI0035A3819A
MADDELPEKICNFYWDIFNVPELEALPPNQDNPNVIQYASFTLSILACCIGLLGNAIVIAATIFLMDNCKSRIWFLNMAIADFIFMLFLPFNAVYVMKANWSFGSHVCKFYHFLTFVNMYASIYLIIALNIDHALSVAKPMWHLKFLSKRICYSVCFLIWLMSTFCSIPVLIYSDEHEYGENMQCLLFSGDVTSIAYVNSGNSSLREGFKSLDREDCKVLFNDTSGFDSWRRMSSTTTNLFILLHVIGYFIPLCVILVTNLVIIVKVKNSQTPSTSRLYRVVIAAIIAFFLTRTPLVLAQIIFLASVNVMEYTMMYKVILFSPLLSSIAVVNSCLNPIIYVLLGKQLRSRIWSTLTGIRSTSSKS